MGSEEAYRVGLELQASKSGNFKLSGTRKLATNCRCLPKHSQIRSRKRKGNRTGRNESN